MSARHVTFHIKKVLQHFFIDFSSVTKKTFAFNTFNLSYKKYYHYINNAIPKQENGKTRSYLSVLMAYIQLNYSTRKAYFTCAIDFCSVNGVNWPVSDFNFLSTAFI